MVYKNINDKKEGQSKIPWTASIMERAINFVFLLSSERFK
jgi:hypothetical protein